jgi:hypothetical protein
MEAVGNHIFVLMLRSVNTWYPFVLPFGLVSEWRLMSTYNHAAPLENSSKVRWGIRPIIALIVTDQRAEERRYRLTSLCGWRKLLNDIGGLVWLQCGGWFSNNLKYKLLFDIFSTIWSRYLVEPSREKMRLPNGMHSDITASHLKGKYNIKQW